MNKTSTPSMLAIAALMAATPAIATSDRAAAPATPPAATAPAAAATTTAAADLVAGEVRRIDVANKKITLKHAEIKSISMPPMTMVFQVRDAALLEQVKVGDKVAFVAEKGNGGYVVTQLQPAP